MLEFGCSCQKKIKKIIIIRVGDDYRIQTNRELYDMNVAKRINKQRFRWLGHVVRIDEDAAPKRVFDAVVAGYRREIFIQTL